MKKDDVINLTYFAIGFSPISALSLSIFDLIPLHISTPLVVIPSIIVALIIGNKFPNHGKLACQGFVGGLIAVFLYDCTRFPIMALGGWPDFIPKIGNWLLNRDQVHWSVGYLWRYLGNGAGMGLAFFMIVPYLERWIERRVAGVVYGIGVWGCLLVTLLASPNGEVMMFQLTWGTFFASLLGHVVFGGVLGLLASAPAAEEDEATVAEVSFAGSTILQHEAEPAVVG